MGRLFRMYGSIVAYPCHSCATYSDTIVSHIVGILSHKHSRENASRIVYAFKH